MANENPSILTQSDSDDCIVHDQATGKKVSELCLTQNLEVPWKADVVLLKGRSRWTVSTLFGFMMLLLHFVCGECTAGILQAQTRVCVCIVGLVTIINMII